jgi:hypothetical protein
MNEQLDKLLIKILFALVLCFLIYIYRFAHRILYPSAKYQLVKNFQPSQNPADTIHLFSRIIGIGFVFSSLQVDLIDKLYYSVLSLLIQGFLGFGLFLVSLYILESITLFSFEYNDEIQKRKNVCYATICFSQTMALAAIMKTVLAIAQGSIILTIMLWLFSIVIMGFAVKFYKWVSELSFNKLVIQKDMTLAFSYMGFIWGITVIIISSFTLNVESPQSFAVNVILNILKAAIVFPFFRWGLKYIFRIQYFRQSKIEEVNYGFGIAEGIMFFTACFLTSVIINQITFGSIYPNIN